MVEAGVSMPLFPPMIYAPQHTRLRVHARHRASWAAATAFFPGRGDLQEYWVEVLDRAIAGTSEMAVPGTVGLLLVSSSESPRLLQLLKDALAAAGCAPTRFGYHSRRRWLEQAASREKNCLVDHVDALPDWLSLADETGIEVVLIFEALPLEGWYAAARTANVDQPATELTSDAANLDPGDDENDGEDEAVVGGELAEVGDVGTPTHSERVLLSELLQNLGALLARISQTKRCIGAEKFG